MAKENQYYLQGLENNKISAAYVAIAKDAEQKPIGFALYKQTPIKEYLAATLERYRRMIL